MNRQKAHHFWRWLKGLSHWHFLVLTVIFGVVSVFALRQNNINAIELRNKVLEVDKQNGDVESALNKLRSYVYAHMNANLSSDTSVYPPIQLKYRYERLVEAEQKRIDKANENLYTKAQQYCERRNSADFSGRNRVPCIQNYVTSRTKQPKPIEDSLYKFDFASPTWSPDLAGWSLVATGFFAFLTIASLALSFWFKYIFNQQQ